MWSPFPVPYCQGDLGDGEFDYSERPVYTHEEYINLVLRSGQVSNMAENSIVCFTAVKMVKSRYEVTELVKD